jgi:hypothetical protein
MCLVFCYESEMEAICVKFEVHITDQELLPFFCEKKNVGNKKAPIVLTHWIKGN